MRLSAVRAVVNAHADRSAVPPPSSAALGFHRALEGYAPTPVRSLDALAAELGLGAVLVKDESARLGLPAFKVLGASWAVERALADAPGAPALVAASAGNHGRAVAHVARRRGLSCRIFLPAGTRRARIAAIASEGAEAVVVDGDYEAAVAAAEREAHDGDALLVADVGEGGGARDVIDGYATLFAEAAAQTALDVLVVPVGVGSLAAAAARFGARAGVAVVGAEPATAPCLTASLAAGEPVSVATPGTVMAGLNCAEVSPAAWPSLRAGIAGTVTVGDDEVAAAVGDLAAGGAAIGESGAAALAALRALMEDERCAALREHVGLGAQRRVLLVATEGPTAG